MQILNALDLKAGKKVSKRNLMGSLTRPIQFIPTKEKTEEWAMENMDWLELEGIDQIRKQAKHMIKNYKLGEGIIDKSDYIASEENEYSDLVNILTRENDSPLELKFYPVIPNIIRILCAEFAKRQSKIIFRATDDISYNEMLEEKRQMIEDVLLQKARAKQQQRMIEMGLQSDSEEAQQMMAPEAIKSLPEIEQFFKKSYKSQVEKWANVQKNVDDDRFAMSELELTAFRDSLTVDREFWHMKMMENDYEVEVWNPVWTFYKKSPGQRYISNGYHVGKVELMSIPDVIDAYGYLMDADQLESLESIFPVHSAKYNIPGYQNDGAFYDATKSKEWNTNMPSLAMRQYNSRMGNQFDIDEILKSGQDVFDNFEQGLLRVTTAYWKSQRKIGHLTKKTAFGETIDKIITEAYRVTEKPEYDNTIFKEKNKNTLVVGEHIDWIWINDVWGGIKIGPNRTSFRGHEDQDMHPLYLGIDSKKVSRLKFQFKGDNNVYGCKLPVEGRVFSDRNTRSNALVDLTKSFQIQYNLVNNQIADILVDELGTVIAFDHNALPKHSMGEDWGRHNLSKAYVAMKNFQMLPFDTSLSNTESPLNFQHYQTLNLEQTNRLLSRVNLANYFKQQLFEVVGITPARIGEQISRQTATGVEESLNASYAQTELYFIQHSDELMPRVHSMRTDLAQYYHSKNPSIRLQYMTSLDETVNFEMNGVDLLSRDFNVYCTTKTNHREIMEKLKNLSIQNNTTGSSIYDLGNILKSDSIAELDMVLKSIEEKMQKQREAEMKHEQDIEQQKLQAEDKKNMDNLNFNKGENDLNRKTEVLVAQIRAADKGAGQDIDANQQSDYLDALDRIEKSNEFRDTMNLKREQEISKTNLTKEQMNLKREELNNRLQIEDKKLQVARTNKNQYDRETKKKKASV